MTQQKPSGNEPENTILKEFLLSFLIVVGVFFLIASRNSSNLFSFARSSPIILGSIGAIIAVIRRFLSRRKRGDKSLFYIITSDFTFDYYASLSLLSFLYALIQGTCFGLSTGFTLTAIAFQLNGTSLEENPMPIFGILVSLLVILMSRLAIEGYTIIYRTAQDAGKYFRGQDRNLNP